MLAERIRNVADRWRQREETFSLIRRRDGLSRAFAVTGWPETASPELIRALLAVPGAKVRMAVHCTPAAVRFDWRMQWKRRRLQTDLAASEFADPEEEGALRAMLRLYDAASSGARLFDVWLVILLEAPSKEELRKAEGTLRERLELLGMSADRMLLAQGVARAAALPQFALPRLPELGVRGRIVDESAAAALYPFTSGSLGDSSGVYVGNRAADGSFVFLDIGNPETPDSQNMVVLGGTGQGKSAFLKSLVTGLLLAGFRVFVLDVDGEYLPLCRAAGGLWVDHTPASGRYFDPVRIPPRIGSGHPLAAQEDAARFVRAAEATLRAASLLLGRELEPEEANAAERAFATAHAALGIERGSERTWDSPKQPSIRDWHAALKAAPSPAAQRLAEALWRYFEGMQAHVFGSAEGFGEVPDAALTVFHIAQAVNSEAEARAADAKLAMALQWIWDQCKVERFRGERFTAVFADEFQRLAYHPVASLFIHTFATTFRKWNGMLVAATNRTAALWETRGGGGAWDSSPYKALFWMEDSEIEALREKLDLPPEVAGILRGLNKTRRYAFRAGERGWDILALALPAEELALYRTRGLETS